MSRPTVTEAELADADGGRSRLARRDWAFLAVLAVLVVAFLADWRGVYQTDRFVFDADLTGLDWLSLYAADVLGFYFCLPLAADRERTVGYLRSVRENRLATASLGVLVAFAVVGLVGPLFFRPDQAVFGQTGGYGVPIGQPPVGFDVFRSGYCRGPKIDGYCHGTWAHPFGTTPGGKDVFGMVVAGARVALQISAVCVALVVPLATAVGTVAATYGGRIDEVLMRYVDLQQSIPAFFVIILAQQALGFINESFGGSLLLIVLVFGLMNWGGVARIVRSEALQLQEQVYVQAARSAGASTFDVVRSHVVPNTLNAVFTALTVQIGWLLLLEASLSFIGIGSATHPSWGYVLTTSVRNGFFPTFYWWGALFPTLALGVVVVAFQTLGDALRDVTDPRAE
ncbi:ABC transporter permease [Halorussus gelatinilyticus]|uniref:ABC transporter permease n=1 Tax=Halorussus gelatinilyticus TaxID=2937524 RepID=A0A8U0IEL9_9EURY|nr:ABC transporter permease [Halorussus gelatinilyticus]UPV98763.1 ABC transporter permease [Halorussus gelatinilyticus]